MGLQDSGPLIRSVNGNLMAHTQLVQMPLLNAHSIFWSFFSHVPTHTPQVHSAVSPSPPVLVIKLIQ